MIIEFLWEIPADHSFQDEAEAVMEKCASSVLVCDGFATEALICVELTDAGGIREINRRMRGIDAETDVLSFPALRLKAGSKAGFSAAKSEIDVKTGAVFLGDVVISVPRAKSQAEEYGHGAFREIGYLCAHSAAHLLGYDHMNEDEKAVMRGLEERAMKAAGLERE